MGLPQLLVKVISYHSAAALVFLIYDIALTLDDEIACIWSKPNTAWIKWTFIFLRYFSLFAQVITRVIQFNIVTSSLESQMFQIWFQGEVVVIHTLMIAVEAVLMVRVYALYSRNRWVKYTFITLVAAETIATVVGIVQTIPHDFMDEFIVLRIPTSFTYFGIAAAVSELTIIILTLVQYRVASRAGWSEAPIVTLMMRDGTAAFILLFMQCVVTIINIMKDSPFATVGYVWFMSAISSAGCRIIINMERLPIDREIETEPSFQLTTFPELSYHSDPYL
ncbi:hypothetical protein C8J56DRAFT_927805 [Mycena floridula]|nr:hypothetical protein C8J56DRAFT_927805 [Mycena floridula]